MRRTYRSKKDTGGGLDHRDVLLTVDEKSSAFDAFYIENLKQTKRELSCMGASSRYNAVSQKVRKKKFVKRIVKDVEKTPRESMSRSTYLTPDKSIRVNKGEDLFDKLLNTSSNVHIEPKIKKDDSFNKIWSGRRAKTYATKRNRKVKKYNYSSSESNETDKENESNNATDIRAHELIVEKEIRNSPKHQDESINNIVQNLSILNNIRNSSSSSPIISFNYGKKRTKQLQSTVIDKSILSSTPLKDIRTATSIYKFSPISRMTYGETTNYVTITEENDNIGALNYIKSPVTHFKQTRGTKGTCSQILANTVNVDKVDLSNVSAIEKCNSSNDTRSPRHNVENITKIVTGEEPQGVNGLEYVSVLSDSNNESDLKISLGGSKPSQLFFGFTNNEHNVSIGDKTIENEVIRLKERYLKDVSSKYNVSEYFINSELVLGGSKPSELFYGFDVDNEINASVVDNNKILDKIDLTVSSNSDKSLDSQGVVSLYDTCNSDKFNEILDEMKMNREPVVKITKINDDVFREYYEKMAAYSSDLSGDEDMDEDSESSNTQDKEVFQYRSFGSQKNDEVEKVVVDSDDYSNPDQNSIVESDNSNAESGNATVSPLKSESDSSSIFESFESNSNNNEDEEVRCFINTRRRVQINRNSNKLSLDNSSSSSICNRTVLSNYKVTKNSITINELSQNEILVSDEDACIIRNSLENYNIACNLDTDSNHSESDEEELKTDSKDSFITIRKSSRKLSAVQNSPGSSMESKPAIVLQPGKKWERSLSIYRRMTMMNDHFDRSILDDESMDRKGRKYRQSVISTMEMQEGSLHNESISSRRSTFVVKPCRSTIRILKDPNNSRISLCNNTVYDDLKDFLSDDCDDTIVELSKLSIADSGHDITVVEKLHEDRLTTARDYVLRRCNQTEVILFDECYPDTALKNCHKIGEGVYGEVFLWRARDGRARVMKIVPVAGSTKVNGEDQKDFHEIISEIVIAMELSAIRTPIADLERQFDEGKEIDALELHNIQNATDVFNEVLAVRCVYGSYTSRLLDLWELYDECKGSENDNPAILPRDQQYIVLELANAGQDLESYQFNSAEQAHALFWQVAYGLAVGEEAYQFEHRDLHWGNVLIAPTEQKWATFVIRGRVHRVARCGVAGTVIDYSLSRLALPLAPPPAPAAALFADLARDDSLFDAVGDYQFQVYRLMRDKLGNDWKNFEPYTNILWLHYTVDKMITALRYKRTNTKIHKHYIVKLKAIKNRILSYGSAAQFVLTDIEY